MPLPPQRARGGRQDAWWQASQLSGLHKQSPWHGSEVAILCFPNGSLADLS